MAMQSVLVRFTCGSWYLNERTFSVGPIRESEAAASMFGISLFDRNLRKICDAEIKTDGPANYCYLLCFFLCIRSTNCSLYY